MIVVPYDYKVHRMAMSRSCAESGQDGACAVRAGMRSERVCPTDDAWEPDTTRGPSSAGSLPDGCGAKSFAWHTIWREASNGAGGDRDDPPRAGRATMPGERCS